jgi:predicted nucleotidyltransferase
MNATL